MRETVLKHIVHLTEPTEELVREVVNIIADEYIYLDMRILAVDALPHLITLCIKRGDNEDSSLVEIAVENINTLLNSPQPPLLHEAVTEALQTIKKTQKGAF